MAEINMYRGRLQMAEMNMHNEVSVLPGVWNSLPADLRNSPSLACFRSQLKTHLFSSSFQLICSRTDYYKSVVCYPFR